MILWRGWGILAVVLGFGGMVAAEATANAIGGPGTYQANSTLWGGLGLLLGGVLTLILGLRWNRGAPATDDAGQAPRPPPRHTLFWIRMEYWAGLLGAVGASMALGSLFT